MNLSPTPIQKFFDNNGRPLVNGRVFTYVAGTSTPIDTYVDSVGTLNSNPIVLDFRGECSLWIDALRAYKFILAPPGTDDPPTNPIWTVDNITAAPVPSDNASNDSGSVNNVALSIPQISAPVAFTRVVFKAANTNTGATTLQINGGSTHAITWQNTGPLSGGEIIANGIYQAIFDGVQWQLEGPTLGTLQMRNAQESGAGVTPSNYSPIPQNPVPKRYGAAGDGVTNDTTAIARTASANRNGLAMIDGGGFTYSVSSVLPASPTPAGFNFYNGRITCPQTVSDTLDGYSVTVFGYGAAVSNTFIPEQFPAGGGIFYAAGNHVVAIGRDALSLNTTGRRMTAVGSKALGSNTTGAYNTAVASHALQDNTTGEENTAVGVQALQKNTTASHNSAFGVSALLVNTTGADNTAVGHRSMAASITGDHNVAVGVQALLGANGASDNIAVGYQAMSAAVTGNFNVGVGSAALGAITSGTNCTAVGRRALAANTASENTAVGADAAVANTSGANLVAVGRNALAANTTAANNTAVGHSALAACDGTNNTAVGRSAGTAITSGTGNTAVGQQALASENTGTNNTAIGNLADSGVSGRTNCTTLGNGSSSTGNNQVTLGNASIGTLRCAVTVITAISDARFKRDIEALDLPDEFIEELQIATYHWIDDDMPHGRQVGVIAQRLDELQTKYGVEWLNLVDKSNPERWEATPGKLLFPLITYTQRLSKRVEALEALVMP